MVPDPVLFQVAVPSTERLDRFLADQLALSRTQAARLVATGAVEVNDAPTRASRSLMWGDLVRVTVPEDDRPRHLTPHFFPLTVVYEDDAMLVVDKPAGLVVHPAPGHWHDTLVNALVARGTSLSGGSAEGRPGIVHRLDKETSGLMLVAKIDQAHRLLGRALAARRIERVYAALVWGHVHRPLEIDAPIARHRVERKRMTVAPHGRPARTHVERVARFDVCDLVRIRLATGRTHQVRVHLAHVGHPVVGDAVYGAAGARRLTGTQRARAEAVARAAGRQALHAASLRLLHPVTGAPLHLRSEWPDDLRPVLAAAADDPALLARPKVLDYFGLFASDA